MHPIRRSPHEDSLSLQHKEDFMKRILAFLSLTTAAALIAFSQPGPGQGSGPGRQPMQGNREPGIMQKLNLTEQQQEQFKKLRLDMERKQIDTQSKVRMARLDLRELMGAEKTDKAQIERKMKEISDLQYQQKVARLDHFLAMKALLTPEQQKIWKGQMRGLRPGMEMRGEMKMRMRGCEGCRGGR